jgi:hypothetical protein
MILHHKRHAFVIISVQYNFLYDLPTHLQLQQYKIFEIKFGKLLEMF